MLDGEQMPVAEGAVSWPIAPGTREIRLSL